MSHSSAFVNRVPYADGYFRLYIEVASGSRIQKEFSGTGSKSETESLLRKAMEDYEARRFIAKPDNLTVGGMLDLWAEESLRPGNLSNGTVTTYLTTIEQIKKRPILQFSRSS